MTKAKTLSADEINHVAKLANLSIPASQLKSLSDAFSETVDFVDQLQEVDVTNITPTSQVTNTTNIWREDEIDNSRLLSQEEALKNAPRKYRGYFVVPKILD